MKTDELIAQLASGLAPVKRLPHPALLALHWLGLALLLLGALVLVSGLRHDVAARLLLPEERVNLAAALVTGVVAAIAAFQLALPDRDARWAWLPVPPALAWLTGLGWGCLRDVGAGGWAGLGLGTSFECMRFILLSGVPLTLAMLWMARHAAALRPEPVAALAGLSAAALSSVALSLIHHLDAAAMILIWHGTSVALLVVATRHWGARAMRAVGPRR